jgi:sulfonate transport system substrate-binding protein
MSLQGKYEGKEIRYTICPVGNSSFIAHKKGWVNEGLSKLGVKASLLYSLPRERWVAHYNHHDDALFREGGNIPPLWAKARGEELLLIGLTFLDQKQYILVKADSPIDSVEQLRQHKLGYQSRPEFLIDFYKATALRGFETALAARGVTKAEVTLVELPVTEADIDQQSDKRSNSGKREIEALESGEVDAIYTRGTRAQKLLDTGNYKVIYDISADASHVFPISNSYPNILTVSRRLAEEAPEVVIEYIKQLLRAAQWAKHNRSEVLELFAEQTHGTPGQVANSRPFDFHRHLATELSERGLLALESQKRLLFDLGIIDQDFAIEKWADDRFLKAALAETGQVLAPAI